MHDPKPGIAPEVGEVHLTRDQGRRPKPDDHQSSQRTYLRDRENVLNDFSNSQAARIDPGQQNNGKDGQKILAIQSNVVRTQSAKPELPRTNRAKFPYPGTGAKPRNQDSRKFCESDRDGGN